MSEAMGKFNLLFDVGGEGLQDLRSIQMVMRNIGQEAMMAGRDVLNLFIDPISKAFESLIPMESSMQQIQALTRKTAEQTKATMQDIAILADRTPFRMQQVLALYTGLSQVGVDGMKALTDASGKALTVQDALNNGWAEGSRELLNQSKVMREMSITPITMVGDLAASLGQTGAQMDRFITEFKIAVETGGKNANRELQTHVPRTIISQIFGSTVDGKRAELSTKQIFDNLFDYLKRKNLIGAMAAGASTVAGILSNLQDLGSAFARNLLGILDPGGGMYGKIKMGLLGLVTELQGFFQVNSAFMTSMKGAITPILESMLWIFEKLVSVMKAVFTFIGDHPTLTKFAFGITAITAATVGLVAGFVALTATVIGAVAAWTMYSAIMSRIIAANQLAAASELELAVATESAAVAAEGATLAAGAGGLAGALEAVVAGGGVVLSFATGLAEVLLGLAVAAGVVYLAYKTNFGGFADIVNNVSDAFEGLWQLISSISGESGEMSTELAASLHASGLYDYVVDIFAVYTRLKSVFEGIAEGFRMMTDGMWDRGMKPIFGLLSDAFGYLFSALGRLAKAFGSDLFGPSPETVDGWKTFGKVIGAIFGAIALIIGVVVDILALVAAVVVSIITGITYIHVLFIELFATMSKMLNVFSEDTRSIWSEMWGGFVSDAKSAVDAVLAALAKLPYLGDYFQGLRNDLGWQQVERTPTSQSPLNSGEDFDMKNTFSGPVPMDLMSPGFTQNSAMTQNAQAKSSLSKGNGGGSQSFSISSTPIYIHLDGQQIGEALMSHQVRNDYSTFGNPEQ